MRNPSGPIGFMCGMEDGMYAAVVTVASSYLCHDPATIVIIFPVTQLHGGDEGGGRLLNTFRECQYRVKWGQTSSCVRTTANSSQVMMWVSVLI